MAKRMPVLLFVERLQAALKRKDGYIMCATGQNPKKWKADSWWFTQYEGKQRTKALYWREHASRVWDCNGLAEGLYKDWSGVDINTKARYNYQQWCTTKGKGMIPGKYRQPGAAVFWGDTPGSIHHVAYLVEPVDPKKPEGDWYLIEARGVMYGVVKTRLLSRKPDFWGLMEKYFDYSANGKQAAGTVETEARLLKNGCEGDDVKELQTNLIRLGYDLGKWGADGEFGDATEMAVIRFQKDSRLDPDGVVGQKTLEALDRAIAQEEQLPKEEPKYVMILDGKCWIRTGPGIENDKIDVARPGDMLIWGGAVADNGWIRVEYEGKEAWVSGRYGRLAA